MRVKRYEQIFGKDFDRFVSMLDSPLKISLRVNPLKIKKEKLLRRLEGKFKLNQIPWYDRGFFIEEFDVLPSKTIEHSLGYYFLQDASSMVPPLVLDPCKEDFVLDLCAAPGAKTTQMAEMMENKGCIVANDITYQRIKALRGNLQRIGVTNAIVIQLDGRKIDKTGLKFSKILIDAPCSGTGSMKRAAMSNLPRILARLSKLQKELICSAKQCLKKDGVLVYSTCSLEPEENECVINFCIKKLGLVPQKIKVKNLPYLKGISTWNEKKFEREVKRCIRILPTQTSTEGFFIAKLAIE